MQHIPAQQQLLFLRGELAEFLFKHDFHPCTPGVATEGSVSETVPEVIAIVLDFFFLIHLKQFRIEILPLQFQRLIGNDIIGLAVVIVIKAEYEFKYQHIYRIAIQFGTHSTF